MYTTRFAPSPSGRLHFGSVVTLVGAYLRARAEGGRFLIRIEDLDFPRCKAEHTESILKEIAALGITPDGPVLIQSECLDRYESLLKGLTARPDTFFCDCTRAALKVRPCTCRDKTLMEGALKIRLTLETGYDDVRRGTLRTIAPLEREVTLKRRDGIIAYHFACVVDDALQGVTEVVRGADLLEETPVQRALIRAMSLKEPAYLHLPLAVHGHDKLSKQNHARAAFEVLPPPELLLAALSFLGQDTAGLKGLNCKALLAMATERFDITHLPLGPLEAPF